jgi:osmotically-inducible protein OsmY
MKGRLWMLALVLASPVHAASWTSDAWITAKAKIALATSEELASSEISVDTVNGRVTLYGKVPGAAQKQKAEDVTKALSGVTDVRNLLQVVPPQNAEAVEASDAKIQHEIEQALANDHDVGSSGIQVASVSAGVVVLGGTARNSIELLRALDIARHVRGVRRVQSTVTIAAGDADLDIWNHHELRQGGRGVLDAASDLWLTTETRLRLLADPRLLGLDVSVDSRDQTITLFGIVPAEDAKSAALEDAKQVSGVRAVRNELQVVPESKQPIVRARDGELEAKVREAIYRRPEMKHAGIHVVVRNGIVRLSGTAPSQQHRLFAVTAAHAVPGVRAVEQDVVVTTVTEQDMARPTPRPTARRRPH